MSKLNRWLGTGAWKSYGALVGAGIGVAASTNMISPEDASTAMQWADKILPMLGGLAGAWLAPRNTE